MGTTPAAAAAAGVSPPHTTLTNQAVPPLRCTQGVSAAVQGLIQPFYCATEPPTTHTWHGECWEQALGKAPQPAHSRNPHPT